MLGVDTVVTEMPDSENLEGELLDLPFGVFLTPLEAAYHLGITADLLFAYTAGRLRSKPRQLETTENGGETQFKRTVLDEFDRYLSEEPFTGNRRGLVYGDSREPRLVVGSRELLIS